MRNETVTLAHGLWAASLAYTCRRTIFAGTCFGTSLALRSGILAVAAPKQLVDGALSAGAVYLYDAAKPAKPFKTIANHNADRALFGARLAIGDHFIAITSLVRMPGVDATVPAFVSLYSHKGTFICDVPNPGGDHDGFGAGWRSRSVAMDGDVIVVGAPFTESSGAVAAGAIYACQVAPIIESPRRMLLPHASAAKSPFPQAASVAERGRAPR